MKKVYCVEKANGTECLLSIVLEPPGCPLFSISRSPIKGIAVRDYPGDVAETWETKETNGH